MARERYLIDGYEITDGWVSDVETRDGMLIAPAPVGSNATVANRTGELWRPKKLGPGRFITNMWIGGGDAADVQARYDTLLRLLLRPGSLRRVVRYLPDGTQRYCDAEVISDLVPSYAANAPLMRLSIEWNVPAGYWQGTTTTTITGTPGAGTKTLLVTGELAKSTTVNERMRLTVTGPIQNAIITDSLGGSTLSYNTSIATGQNVTFDCRDWSAVGSAGHTVQKGAIRFSDSRFFSLAPKPPVSGPAQNIVMTGTGTGSGTNLSVSGEAIYAV